MQKPTWYIKSVKQPVNIPVFRSHMINQSDLLFFSMFAFYLFFSQLLFFALADNHSDEWNSIFDTSFHLTIKLFNLRHKIIIKGQDQCFSTGVLHHTMNMCECMNLCAPKP